MNKILFDSSTSILRDSIDIFLSGSKALETFLSSTSVDHAIETLDINKLLMLAKYLENFSKTAEISASMIRTACDMVRNRESDVL